MGWQLGVGERLFEPPPCSLAAKALAPKPLSKTNPREEARA